MNAIPVEASVPGENARSEHTSSCIGNNEKQSSDCNERVIQGVKTVDTDIGKTEVSDNNPNTVFDVHPRKMTDTSANLDDIGKDETFTLVDDKVGSIQIVHQKSNSNRTQHSETEILSKQPSLGKTDNSNCTQHSETEILSKQPSVGKTDNSNCIQHSETEILSKQPSVGVMNHHGSISFHTQEMVLKKNDDKRINEAEDESTEVAHKEGVSNQMKIEQLTKRLEETESKIKTEVARVKKQYQLQVTELEMSLDSANKHNIDLQKTTKKQNLQITELKSHYDENHQKLQQTVDQLEVCQRRCQAFQAELDETRASLDSAQRFKRTAEQSLEEAQSLVKELTTENTRLICDKTNVETELSGLQADYDVLQKELRATEERATRAETELRHTKDRLTQEQDRFLKMDSIKNALEVEVRNLQNRIEEVESNALAGSKRMIAKLETKIRDIEIDYEEEKRRHAETQKVIRKKEHRLKELLLQTEEDHDTILSLKDCVESLSEKCKTYKRQLSEQEGVAQQNQARVRRFQRELESAEDRADQAEGNLSLIRIKHKTWVPTNQDSGSILQVPMAEK